MNCFEPEINHSYVLKSMKQTLSYENCGEDYTQWREKVKSKLIELLGLPQHKIEANIVIEYEKEWEDYYEKRFVFASEPRAEVPCHLLIPKNGKAPYPVVICLQGHSSGMHISLGRPKYEGDEACIDGERDFALQAVKEGYASLVIEQRCLGERKDRRSSKVHFDSDSCRHASMNALLLGRTMIGERVWDVSRAIDMLCEFPEIDIARIGCMGNSGGGTIAYYAACIDERISVTMPSCAVCTYKGSIAQIDHCVDNYIPGILKYFEMGDLACLIAPRPLIIVAGKEDNIFPVDAVKENYETIKQIYNACGAQGKCRLIIGEGGHRFYKTEGWMAYRELLNVNSNGG